MNRRLRIQHTCDFRYAHQYQYSAQALRLTPRRDSSQHALSWSLHAPGRRVEQVDAHGNITHLLTLEESHRSIEVVVTGLVEIAWTEQALPHEGMLSPLAYLATTALTQPTRDILHLADSSRPQNGANWEWITHLGRAVRELHASDAPSRDIAHAFLACCRAAGVPGRYVSGYRQADDDRADRIAWVDVWCAAQDGWIALDVDHLEPARSRHCRLAVGRDYLDAAPLRTPPLGRVSRNFEDSRLMTYCVGMLLDTGLVFLADSRTSAGVDQINSFRKTAVFQRPGERVLVLQCAGNLAITQAVVHAAARTREQQQQAEPGSAGRRQHVRSGALRRRGAARSTSPRCRLSQGIRRRVSTPA